MVNFDLITNMELRLLATSSETLNALPQDEAQSMVDRISTLDEAGQKKFIQALRDERLNGWKIKEKLGITPEVQMKTLEDNRIFLAQIEKNFTKDMKKLKNVHFIHLHPKNF
jgi:ribosomal protein L9